MVKVRVCQGKWERKRPQNLSKPHGIAGQVVLNRDIREKVKKLDSA